MMLVSLAVAKEQFRVTDPARDAELTTTIEHASDAIFKYIDTRADPSWDDTSAPGVVQRATLILAAAHWNDKGDGNVDAFEHAWNEIQRLLRQTRDPAMA
jgi:hypothetical protein